MKKGKKQYSRLRMDSGQHRRILLAAAILGAAAFVPVALRLWGLMIRDHDRYAALALKKSEYEGSLDLEKIRREALALGLVPQEEIPQMEISVNDP